MALRAGQWGSIRQALCRRAGHPEFWSDAGPTPAGEAYRVATVATPIKPGCVLNADATLVLLAFDFMTEPIGRSRLADITDSLEGPDLRAVGMLLVALSADDEHDAAAVDAWLAAQDAELRGVTSQVTPSTVSTVPVPVAANTAGVSTWWRPTKRGSLWQVSACVSHGHELAAMGFRRAALHLAEVTTATTCVICAAQPGDVTTMDAIGACTCRTAPTRCPTHKRSHHRPKDHGADRAA